MVASFLSWLQGRDDVLPYLVLFNKILVLFGKKNIFFFEVLAAEMRSDLKNQINNTMCRWPVS